MASLENIRTALAIAASTVDDVQGYDYVPAVVNTPAVVVGPEGITFDVDLDGGATYRIPLQVLVSLGDWESAQRTIDPLLSHDGDLVAAINGMQSYDCQVQLMQDYGLVEYGTTSYLGASLLVEVFA